MARIKEKMLTKLRKFLMIFSEYVKRCKNTIQTEVFKNNLYVCPECGSHVRIGSRERISQIIDEGTFEEMDADITTVNTEFKGYTEKA